MLPDSHNKATDSKVERVGVLVSEVREHLAAAERREKEMDEKMAQRIEALQEAIERRQMRTRVAHASTGTTSAGSAGGGDWTAAAWGRSKWATSMLYYSSAQNRCF